MVCQNIKLSCIYIYGQSQTVKLYEHGGLNLFLLANRWSTCWTKMSILVVNTHPLNAQMNSGPLTFRFFVFFFWQHFDLGVVFTLSSLGVYLHCCVVWQRKHVNYVTDDLTNGKHKQIIVQTGTMSIHLIYMPLSIVNTAVGSRWFVKHLSDPTFHRVTLFHYCDAMQLM